MIPVVAVVLIAGLILSRVLDTKTTDGETEISIPAEEAVNHAGTVAEVCGRVASADYLPEENGQPTFLNFGKPYPNQVFTAVIFGEDRPQFSSPPEERYLHRSICVSGTIRIHEGIPQIVVSGPNRISTTDVPGNP